MASFEAPEDDWSDTGCAERVAGAITDLADRLRLRLGPDAAGDQVVRLERLLLEAEFAKALALCTSLSRDGERPHGLFLAAIRRLEARWKADAVGFAQLAFGFFQIRRLIDMLSEPALPDPTGFAGYDAARVLIALAPGERHEFGAQILAAELSLHGWAVDLDLTGDGNSVCKRVVRTRYEMVALSVLVKYFELGEGVDRTRVMIARDLRPTVNMQARLQRAFAGMEAAFESRGTLPGASTGALVVNGMMDSLGHRPLGQIVSETARALETLCVTEALRRCNGDADAAARLLGIDATEVRRRARIQ